ncbi:MAG: hypothetical protein ABI307_08290, partial [Mycobacterium sp.]
MTDQLPDASGIGSAARYLESPAKPTTAHDTDTAARGPHRIGDQVRFRVQDSVRVHPPEQETAMKLALTPEEAAFRDE